MTKKSEKKHRYEISYGEFSSNYKKTDKISYCILSHKNNDERSSDENLIDNKKGASIFFIPEVGVSYRSYFPYLKELLRTDVDSIFTYDHFGSGSSGGARGTNSDGKSYLNDFILAFNFFCEIHGSKEIIVFGHGFGATLALLAESEGEIDRASGIIVENPFLYKSEQTKLLDVSNVVGLKRFSRYFKSGVFSGRSFFPAIENELAFDQSCLNSKSFTINVILMIKELSKNVIGRAYLTEKPVLHIYSNKKGARGPSELITLYQKGVGENKVKSIELGEVGYFDNFFNPNQKNVKRVVKWINNLKGDRVGS